MLTSVTQRSLILVRGTRGLAVLCCALLWSCVRAAGTDATSEFDASLLRSQTPARLEDAVTELNNLLPAVLKKQIDPLTAALPDELENHVVSQLIRRWKLDDWNSALTRDLVTIGLTKPDDMARTLVAGTLEPAVDRDRLSRSFALARFDGKVIDPVPPTCAEPTGRRIDIERIKLAGYSRDLHWTTCKNGRVLYYLWERGWFEPDSALQALACKGQGDHPHDCPSS